MNNYFNACSEVYEILRYLKEDEFNKIPTDVVDVIEQNRNKEYIFKFDKNLELRNQKLLDETRAILFNLFRDYLATSKQKEKIIQMQKEEREKIEKEKYLKYNLDEIFNKNVIENKIEQSENLIEIKKENFFQKIINKIRNFFNKRNY